MTIDDFESVVVEVLGTQRRPNPRQMACIAADLYPSTLIVAGPGSGKTAVLVLRALRHVILDQISPADILITTFTIKAAKEIRTRLIEWGEPIIAHLKGPGAARLSPEELAFLESVDVNRFVTGTLDAVCQDALTQEREPGERRFAVVEGFAADVLLARAGDIYTERNQVVELDTYLGQYTLFGDPPRNTGEAVRTIRSLIDRFLQDDVDVVAYAAALGPFPGARAAIQRIHDRYVTHLRDERRLDFALLERIFLDRVVQGRTPGTVRGIRAILVDEYQDTNPLQERLYLELARATGAALTVVGDDDQSLYRFRGATIELFRDFRQRAQQVLGNSPAAPLYLVENYRSSPEIVDFYNRFIVNDPDFAGARIQPPKPAIVPIRPSASMPILGMFRDDVETLAEDLASFLEQVFRGGGRPGDASLPEDIRPSSNGGDIGDAVLLGSTVGEVTHGGRQRLPSFLRRELSDRSLGCFNPRGRALRDVPEVTQLLGLVLMCLEPSSPGLSIDGAVGQMRLTREALQSMTGWRAAAVNLLASSPAPVKGVAINTVLSWWQNFVTSGGGPASEWPLLDVFYAFIPWLPGFRDDPEGQVYLEAITRCASQAGTFSKYRGLLLREQPHRSRSVLLAIKDVLQPIAEDLVAVDEEIMPSVPRDRLNIMTIHQAKGLEFPLVIVDVSSDFKTNHHKQRFRRFPEEPAPPAKLEDDLAAHTPIGALRMSRDAMQRSFEDIIRLYYVAYSRPQSLLLLVGCRQGLRSGTGIRNVAQFWRRDGTWAWHNPNSGAQSVASNIPLTLI